MIFTISNNLSITLCIYALCSQENLTCRILTLTIIPGLLLLAILLKCKVEQFPMWRRSSQSLVKMTALTTSYTCRNFSQWWPSCHLQNSNLLPFPLLVQLHLHFSQGLLFSLWWNSNGTKIIFSFATTCTKGQGNFQCCPKTEGQHQGPTGRFFLLRDGSGRVLAKYFGYQDRSGWVVKKI